MPPVLQAYSLGVQLEGRIAAIVPNSGSFAKGFMGTPTSAQRGMPVMDLHGDADRTVPANASGNASWSDGGGWWYTPVSDILAPWAAANGCGATTNHFPTPLDGKASLFCVGFGGAGGACENGGGASVVRCSFEGGHQWFSGGGGSFADLAWFFLSQFSNPGHAGKGGRRTPAAPSVAAQAASSEHFVLG